MSVDAESPSLAERVDKLGSDGRLDGAMIVKLRIDLLEEFILSPVIANAVAAAWERRLEAVVDDLEQAAARDKLTEGIQVAVPDLSSLRQ